MFHKRELNNRITKIHQRVLRVVYQNRSLFFSELIDMDNAATIHKRNLQFLVPEIFKVKNNLSPGKYFTFKSHTIISVLKLVNSGGKA